MSYQRIILHYGHDPTEYLGELSSAAIKGCWFDLHRQGGCGAGELKLKTDFPGRYQLEPGHWLAFEYGVGERWYLGRVEEIETESPAGMRVQLEGAGIELNEVFPGALVARQDGVKPHRYARVDRFSEDPDRLEESVDVVMNSRELLQKLLTQYVVPGTNILYESTLVESGPISQDVTSVKMRGEESVRSLLKDLAMRARNASWGVDAERRFFFLQQKEDLLTELQEDVQITLLKETRARDLLYNRLLLTGDYVYDRRDNSDQIARRSYRWRGNYRHVTSAAIYGERRLRLWIPWIRTGEDARQFASEFFRVYAYPTAQFLIETAAQQELTIPWLGRIRLKDRQQNILIEAQPETIRVYFDHLPRMRMELGPTDPHRQWAEPTHDERWELPEKNSEAIGDSDFSTFVLPSESGLMLTNTGLSSGGVSSGIVFSSSGSEATEVSDSSDVSEASEVSVSSDGFSGYSQSEIPESSQVESSQVISSAGESSYVGSSYTESTQKNSTEISSLDSASEISTAQISSELLSSAGLSNSINSSSEASSLAVDSLSSGAGNTILSESDGNVSSEIESSVVSSNQWPSSEDQPTSDFPQSSAADSSDAAGTTSAGSSSEEFATTSESSSELLSIELSEEVSEWSSDWYDEQYTDSTIYP